MAGNYTPGPWRVGEMCGGCINIEFDGAPGHPRRTVGRVHVVDAVAEAEGNARLFAAAPELVEALRSVLEWADPFALPGCDRNERTTDAARALLARIEGQP